MRDREARLLPESYSWKELLTSDVSIVLLSTTFFSKITFVSGMKKYLFPNGVYNSSMTTVDTPKENRSDARVPLLLIKTVQFLTVP